MGDYDYYKDEDEEDEDDEPELRQVEIPLLLDQSDFVECFRDFQKLCSQHQVTVGVENEIKLFEMWFENTKDQRALSLQEKLAYQSPPEDDSEGWRRGEPPV